MRHSRTALLGLLAPLAACAVFQGAPPEHPVDHPESPPIDEVVQAAPEPEPAPEALLYRLLLPTEGERDDGLPLVRDMPADDPAREALEGTLSTEYLQWVLRAGEIASSRARERCLASGEQATVCDLRFDHPALFVIKERGNRPKQGLAIEAGGAVVVLPEAWYVEVDPRRAETLIPHEYGHVMMFESLVAEPPEHPGVLPHTTAAITDDVTAFSEGWGIHFETLAGGRSELPATAAWAGHDRFATAGEVQAGDSLFAARDLLSYSQSYRRHGCIKDNCFAYLPRTPAELVLAGTPTPEQLLERWTDATVDPAELRTLEQMVASEGLVATLFYRLATGGEPSSDGPPLPDPLRYAAFFDAFAAVAWQDGTPTLLEFLQHLLVAAGPDERPRLARTILEVVHYVGFVDEATGFHAELHALGHRMEMGAFRQAVADASEARVAAVDRLVLDPTWLSQVAAPELWVTVPGFELAFGAFGMPPAPLVIDLNAAPVEFLMALPDIGWEEASGIVARRGERGGFATAYELATVDELIKGTVAVIAELAWVPAPPEPAPTGDQSP